MNANTCVICRQPILGYWYELGKNNVICQSCASFTTIYDLYQNGVIDIKPDIIEVEPDIIEVEPLVTKDDEKKSPLDEGVQCADEDSNVPN